MHWWEKQNHHFSSLHVQWQISRNSRWSKQYDYWIVEEDLISKYHLNIFEYNKYLYILWNQLFSAFNKRKSQNVFALKAATKPSETMQIYFKHSVRPKSLFSYRPIPITTDISDFHISQYQLWYRYNNCHIGRYWYIVNFIKCNFMVKNEYFFVIVTCISSTDSLKWFSDFVN